MKLVRVLRPDFSLALVLKSESYFLLSDLNLPLLASFIDELLSDEIFMYCFGTLGNAIATRKMGIKKRIQCLYHAEYSEASDIARYQIEVGCPNKEWYDLAIQSNQTSFPLLLHFWLDVGLGREGYLSIQHLVNDVKMIQNQSSCKVMGFAAQCQIVLGNEKVQDVLTFTRKEQRKYRLLMQPQIQRFEKLRTQICLSFPHLAFEYHMASSKHVALNLTEMAYSYARIGTIAMQGFFQHTFIPLSVLGFKFLPLGTCILNGCEKKILEKNTRIAFLNAPFEWSRRGAKIINRKTGHILPWFLGQRPNSVQINTDEPLQVGDSLLCILYYPHSTIIWPISTFYIEPVSHSAVATPLLFSKFSLSNLK